MLGCNKTAFVMLCAIQLITIKTKLGNSTGKNKVDEFDNCNEGLRLSVVFINKTGYSAIFMM